MHTEKNTFQRLSFIIWALTIIVALADMALILAGNVQIALEPLPYFATGFAGCIVVMMIGKYLIKDHSVVAFALGLLQMNLAAIALGWFSYLCARFNFPLLDEKFIAADRLLGFDWMIWLYWMSARPNIADILSACYWVFSMQAVALLCLLYAFKHIERAQIYIASFILTCAITALLSGLFPAVGAYVHYNLLPADYPNIFPAAPRVHEATLLQLRDHSFNVLPWLQNVKGLITFPSFHAAAAILFMYAGFAFRRVRLLLIALNVGMIVSTPIDGGHYLVDVISGIAIASLSLALIIRLSRPKAACC